MKTAKRFQFTHPGGVRRGNSPKYPFYYGFQFTHPGGVRLYINPNLCEKLIVSIHAPGRGATDGKLTYDHTIDEFQFTHPGGVRQYGAKLRIMGRINKRNLRLEVLL